MENSPYKVFVGNVFYPNGGYLDFCGIFPFVASAIEYVENKFISEDMHVDMWAHIVLENHILLYGYFDLHKDKKWQWRIEE